MSVENVTGFAPDEILLIKKVSGSNFSTEYVQVISSSNDFNSDTNFQGKLMVSEVLVHQLHIILLYIVVQSPQQQQQVLHIQPDKYWYQLVK